MESSRSGKKKFEGDGGGGGVEKGIRRDKKEEKDNEWKQPGKGWKTGKREDKWGKGS